MSLNLSGVFVTCEEYGCIYTVCTEGELFYAPIHNDGKIDFDEFNMVDFWECDVDVEELEKIQSILIDMMKCAGLYFQQPSFV
jgi:hypothetical protein